MNTGLMKTGSLLLNIKSVAVFCGSSTGAKPEYIKSARETGRIIGSADLDLIFGGGNVGLMGAVSGAAVMNGANVTGVLPERISGMLSPTEGIRLISVKTMHERKQKMYDLADGFLILPGGIGTFEEAFEVCTWNQLGYMSKPLCFINISGFYSPLRAFLRNTVDEKFLKQEHYCQIHFEDTPEKALRKIIGFQPEYVSKL